ncbi:hypothetical protein [Fructobacillus cardui]|uniref:hypothetical protein n=1 Tax=Fructobacillus cardui TaxID=2893170 RepID=UPI0030C80B58
MTIKENFGHLAGLKVAYLGDGCNNVAHSLLVGCAMVGVNVAIVSPESLQPAAEVLEIAQGYAKETDLQNAYYGLADIYENPGVSYIANPGCYATATLLGLAPAVMAI